MRVKRLSVIIFSEFCAHLVDESMTFRGLRIEKGLPIIKVISFTVLVFAEKVLWGHCNWSVQRIGQEAHSIIQGGEVEEEWFASSLR